MSNGSATAAVLAEGLGRDYGAIRAVDAIDLHVRPGEFFGFLGPNGAGKTTTIQMLTTLLRPSRGTATVAGRSVLADATGVRRRIGVVFQETTLDLDLTAEENLRFCTRLYGLSRRESSERIDAVIELFGLGARRREPVRRFSGGMRRALDLARGILHRPAVLFLDEPTLGLDPAQRRRIWGYLGRLAADSGTTLFLTTHYLDEADSCDRVAIIAGGRMIAEGTPAELKGGLGRETIEVEGEPLDELAAAVEELTGIAPHRDARGLSLVVADAGELLPRLLPLTQRGAQVRVGRPTLEDVFVALTDGDRT